MLYFETTVEKAVVYNILSFLLHLCFDIIWVVVRKEFFLNMEGSTADEESCR